MGTARFLLAAALLILVTASSVLAFDIAIYGDPRSEQNYRYVACRRYGCDTSVFVNTETLMDSVYDMYTAMGVTHVMVMYPFQSDFNHVLADCTDIKLMNWFYPGLGKMHGEKYVDAQYRVVQVGQTQEDDGVNWSFRNSIRNPAIRVQEGGPSYFESDRRPVVAMGPGINNGDGSPDTLWRATSELGAFSGWDWAQTGWLDSSFNMPMHYRLTWAVDPDGPISTNTPLADFYWIVKIPDRRLSEFPSLARWWRFPVKTLTLPQPSDTNNWIESPFYEDAHSGTYTLLDADFDSLTPVSWEEIYLGPTHLPRGLDDVTSWEMVSYGMGTEVRMAVNYRGTHDFYLNRIEVYDEGTWRMFASADHR